jgi:putative transposase
VLDFIAEAKAAKVSERITCMLIGISTKTIQNWRRHGLRDRRKGSERVVQYRLSDVERQKCYDIATSKRFMDLTPEQIVAILAQEKTYIASASTFYRVLRDHQALEHRRESKKPRAGTPIEKIEVTGPNQVWSWDITWLKTDVLGVFKYAYSIIDLYDRTLIGWTIEDNESDEHAKHLFARIIRDLKVVPKIVHADNGHPMRGISLAVFLDRLMVTRSYSRPRCSNDNPFIESWHKTLKYSVGYPAFFTSLEHARTWFAKFVHWYNTEHLHSGLGYVTPMQKRTGSADTIYSTRNQTIREAMSRTPGRWRRRTTRTYGSKPVTAVYRPLTRSA